MSRRKVGFAARSSSGSSTATGGVGTWATVGAVFILRVDADGVCVGLGNESGLMVIGARPWGSSIDSALRPRDNPGRGTGKG